jgi:predicted dehydrogenase
VEDQFFVRPASLRLLWSYVRDIGPRAVLRKIWSRRSERERNAKFLSVGMGRVIEGGAPEGAIVAFLAPNHPLCVDRLCLPAGLTQTAEELNDLLPPPAQMRFADLREDPPDVAQELDSWSPFAGRELPNPMPALVPLVAQSLGAARLIERPAREPISERFRSVTGRDPKDQRPSCTVIGFGNYAKSTLLPFLSQELAVTTIHEIDPCQIGPISRSDFGWDTAPSPAADDDANCWAIANYHHLHAPLAAEALRRGKSAIIEKPLAVSADALEDFLDAFDSAEDGRVFMCFQRRYARFNPWIAADIREHGGPLDYHCMVFEESLPTLHWYRWPLSGSRLTSNGCHWIDHFLFLNGYSMPVETEVKTSRRGVINCSIELENGAFFTMVLTDEGSPRIGVQDVVDIRCGRRTARIVNNSEYVAEGPRHVVRRKRVNKRDAYARMYRTIGRRIAQGAQGDTRESLEVPARVTQILESQLEPA